MRNCAKMASLAFAMLLGAMPMSARPNVRNLAFKCSRGKQSACNELAKLAEHDKDSAVRIEAVDQLRDQPLLGEIALEGEDEKVRNAAFSKLTDQAQLEKVAREAKDQGIRTAAEQALLARAAVTGGDASVRRSAVEKLMDQLLLANVAESDRDEGVRNAAVSTLARMSVAITTVSAEREVYIWRPSTGGAETARPRWKINASLGKGGMAGTGPIDPEIFLNGAAHDPGPAPGFDVWYFAPRDSSDRLTLEPGSTLNWYGGMLPGPITFIGLTNSSSGETFWATLPNQVGGFARFHTVLYPGPGGALVLGGGLFLSQGGRMNVMSIPAVPVSVTGTIRFSGDRWISAKPGLSVKGGGVQFDETGAFLIPGTQYLRKTN